MKQSDRQSLDAAEAFDLIGSLASVIASAGGPYQSQALAVSRLCRDAAAAIVYRGKSLQDVLLDIQRVHLGALIDPEEDRHTVAETPTAKRRRGD